MRNVAADIAAILEASSLTLTLGDTLFSGPFPVQAKGMLVGVMPLTGTGEPYADARGDLWTVDVEVTVRGEPHAYKATLDLALAVFGVLHRAQAQPYVSILCDDAVPEWDGYDEQNRPVFTITLTLVYETTRAGESLVVLPSEGLLRVDGVEFNDGSTLTSAPPPVDLSGYVTETGTQTLTNKTLASPTVTGALLPATAGQQELGSAAVPWGPMYLRADGNTAGEGGPLEVDGGNITNQRVANFRNLGLGTTGPRFFRAAGGWMDIAHSLGNSWLISVTNRTLRFRAAGRTFDSAAPQGFAFSDDQATRAVVAITGTQPVHGRTADLLQFRPFDDSLPEASVARVGVDGEIETVAGVVLHSPNGTRHRITVSDAGALVVTPL